MTGAADANGTLPDEQVAPVDWAEHFGEEGRARQLASLRVLLSAFTGVPGIIGLHGGLPPADAFPFTDMSFTLRDGTKMHITDPAQVWNSEIYALYAALCCIQTYTSLGWQHGIEVHWQWRKDSACMLSTRMQVTAAQQYRVTLRGYRILY